MNTSKTPADVAVTPDSVSTPSGPDSSRQSPEPSGSADLKQTPVLTCQIQWVDRSGQPTPDTNLAVGRVRRERHFHTLHGRTVEIPQTDWFYICAHHARQLQQPGMEHWRFEPLPPEPLSGLVMDGPPR